MKALIDAAVATMPDDTPSVVREAMHRLSNKLGKPPVPVMAAEEFAKLDGIRKAILTCNMPGCGDVVCTHGMLCVKHKLELAEPITDQPTVVDAGTGAVVQQPEAGCFSRFMIPIVRRMHQSRPLCTPDGPAERGLNS